MAESTVNDIITIDVGGKRFTSRRSVFEKSEFIKTVLSRRWNCGEIPFIDADPDDFRDILNAIRLSHTAPIHCKALIDYLGFENIGTPTVNIKNRYSPGPYEINVVSQIFNFTAEHTEFQAIIVSQHILAFKIWGYDKENDNLYDLLSTQEFVNANIKMRDGTELINITPNYTGYNLTYKSTVIGIFPLDCEGEQTILPAGYYTLSVSAKPGCSVKIEYIVGMPIFDSKAKQHDGILGYLSTMIY